MLELDMPTKVERISIIVQVLQDFARFHESFSFKWKVWISHDFFNNVSLKILVHARVDVKSILVFISFISVNPSSSNFVRLLKCCHFAVKSQAMSDSTQTRRPSSNHTKFHIFNKFKFLV